MAGTAPLVEKMPFVLQEQERKRKIQAALRLLQNPPSIDADAEATLVQAADTIFAELPNNVMLITFGTRSYNREGFLAQTATGGWSLTDIERTLEAKYGKNWNK